MRRRGISCRRTSRSRIGGRVRSSLPLRNSRISVIPKDLAFIRNYISHICFDCVKQYYHCRVCCDGYRHFVVYSFSEFFTRNEVSFQRYINP